MFMGRKFNGSLLHESQPRGILNAEALASSEAKRRSVGKALTSSAAKRKQIYSLVFCS